MDITQFGLSGCLSMISNCSKRAFRLDQNFFPGLSLVLSIDFGVGLINVIVIGRDQALRLRLGDLFQVLRQASHPFGQMGDNILGRPTVWRAYRGSLFIAQIGDEITHLLVAIIQHLSQLLFVHRLTFSEIRSFIPGIFLGRL